MKWEDLKKAVVKYVDELPADEFNQIRCNAQGDGKTVAQYMDGIDVRRVAGVREHARPAFPKYLRRGSLWVDKDNQGNWTVTDRDPRRW